MKVIRPTIENITPKEYDYISMLKHIERCARVCYKSEDIIDESSYARMRNTLLASKHFSPFEHGTVYLEIPKSKEDDPQVSKLLSNHYTRFIEDDGIYLVTTNMRVLIENDLTTLRDLYLAKSNEKHLKRHTFLVHCSIGCSREWNRHRSLSICEQSTRFCNYGKGKFNNELTFIHPEWATYLAECRYDIKTLTEVSEEEEKTMLGTTIIFDTFKEVERAYMRLIELGYKPQEARDALPLSLATEVVYTGFKEDWEAFCKLRCSPKAHYEIKALATEIANTLQIKI